MLCRRSQTITRSQCLCGITSHPMLRSGLVSALTFSQHSTLYQRPNQCACQMLPRQMLSYCHVTCNSNHACQPSNRRLLPWLPLLAAAASLPNTCAIHNMQADTIATVAFYTCRFSHDMFLDVGVRSPCLCGMTSQPMPMLSCHMSHVTTTIPPALGARELGSHTPHTAPSCAITWGSTASKHSAGAL